jgi:hypothetical protein
VMTTSPRAESTTIEICGSTAGFRDEIDGVRRVVASRRETNM